MSRRVAPFSSSLPPAPPVAVPPMGIGEKTGSEQRSGTMRDFVCKRRDTRPTLLRTHNGLCHIRFPSPFRSPSVILDLALSLPPSRTRVFLAPPTLSFLSCSLFPPLCNTAYGVPGEKVNTSAGDRSRKSFCASEPVSKSPSYKMH